MRYSGSFSIFIPLFLCIGLFSCDSKSTDSSSKDGCYQFKNDKDEIYMKLSSDGKAVNGDLNYLLFEKDKNTGKIAGQFYGDTLIANYVFESEGTKSVREVAFLYKTNSLTEGYGEMIDKDGKMVFKDRKNIIFSSNMVLNKGNCPN